MHLSDLSDGGVPLQSGERPTILFMTCNEKRTATVNETIRLEAISFNPSRCLTKVEPFFFQIKDNDVEHCLRHMTFLLRSLNLNNITSRYEII